MFLWVFNLAPSSAIYFFCCLISSNLLYLWSPFCSLRGLVPLASCVCPLVGEVSPRAWVGFLLGRTGSCVLVDGAESCPSDRQGRIKWCILGVFVNTVWLLAACLLIGGAVCLSCYLFDLRRLILEPAGSCDPIYLWGLHYYPKEFPNFIENLFLRVLVAFYWPWDGQRIVQRQPKALFWRENGKPFWSWAKGMDREKYRDWNLVSPHVIWSLSCKCKGLLAVFFLLSCDLNSINSRYMEKNHLDRLPVEENMQITELAPQDPWNLLVADFLRHGFLLATEKRKKKLSQWI